MRYGVPPLLALGFAACSSSPNPTIGDTDDAGSTTRGSTGSPGDLDDGVDTGSSDTSTSSDGEPEPSCGNGALDPDELCDEGIEAGLRGSCPTACRAPRCMDAMLDDDGPCQVRCTLQEVAPGPADGCCPAGADRRVDEDCPPTCENGVVDPGETCDPSVAGSCPEACDDGDPCTSDVLVGAGTCRAECTVGPEDLCALACGDGEVQAWEACDIAVDDGDEGACPTQCDDDEPCTTDALQDADTCDATCVATAIVAEVSGDGCCLAGTNPADDDDCPDTCGDGTVDPWEVCDTAIVAGPGVCSTLADCDDDDPCTTDSIEDAGSCVATCSVPPITEAIAGDQCCPDGENSLTDDDCEPIAQCEPGDVIVGSAFDPSASLVVGGDHEGALWALWAEDGGAFDDIRAARLDPATAVWAPDVPVEATPNDVRVVDLGRDGDGELWALWAEDGGIADDIRGARLDAATGAWQADVPIGTTFDEAVELVAASDQEAALWALWVEDGGIADNVRAARHDTTTGTWQADVGVGTTFDDALHIAATTDHEGALWVAWVEAGGTDDIRGARLDPQSGGWEADVAIGTSFDPVDDLVLSLDDDGALWALWTENGGIASDVRAARLDPTMGTWESDVSVQTSFDPLHDLVAGRDADGTLRASWIEDGGIVDAVRSAHLDPSSGLWQNDVEIGSTFDQAASLVSGRGADGATWAIWAEFDGLEAVRAARLDPVTGVWAPDVSVESTVDTPLEVAAGSDPSGELWAVWIRDGPLDGSQVRATSCGFF
ncbi:MAG: hypothetical protein AAF721_16340 [Myxococcota bacterium]